MNAPGLEGSQLQRKSADRRIFPLMGRCAGNAWTLSLESLKRPNSGLLNNGEKVRIPIGEPLVCCAVAVQLEFAQPLRPFGEPGVKLQEHRFDEVRANGRHLIVKAKADFQPHRYRVGLYQFRP